MSRRSGTPHEGALLLVIVALCLFLYWLLGALFAMIVYWRSLL